MNAGQNLYPEAVLRRATLQPLEAEVVQNEAVLSPNHDGL